LVVYSGQRIFGTIGPSRAFAAADGRLYLLSHGKIHVFGADGSRLQAIDLRALGVHPRPSDFEVHRDGRLVMADPNESVLARCVPPSGPCERIDVTLLAKPGQEVLPLNAAKLHIDEGAGRYYVSDNSGHRVVVADFAGHVLGASRPMTVYYPNQLATVAVGALAVVDTGHRRIATFDVSGDRVGALLRQMSTDAPGIVRPGRRLPLDSVHLADGGTWVLIARERMRDADLVLFDAGGAPRTRVDLGDDSDPFDIEAWRGRIWIADATNYRFESVALDGSDPRSIEDRSFAAELASEHEAAQRWIVYRWLARIGMVVAPILGLAVLWRLGMLNLPRASSAEGIPAVVTPAGMMVTRVVTAVAVILIALAIGWRLLHLL
jgi:hypothetical protein